MTTKTKRRTPKPAQKSILAWHFAGDTLRDGRPLPKKGDILRHDGNVIPCQSGLHGSVRAIDTLAYMPGFRVARVRLSGVIVSHGNPTDKYAASVRENLSDYIDARDAICAWIRCVALRAMRVHAPAALEAAGLHEQAAKLRALPDDTTAGAASYAASYAVMAVMAAMAAARAASDAERELQNTELTALLLKLTGCAK